MKTHINILAQFLLGVVLAPMFATLAIGAERPNILFLLTDDQASWAIGRADPLGQAITPNMDRLAQRGAYLPNAYTVTPVCSPSRASTMTSRYGSELRITDWLHPSSEAKRGLDHQFPVWPRLLQQAGYRTGLVGKWHLGLPDEYHPTTFGFDYFMGHRHGGFKTVEPDLEKNGEYQKFRGLTADILADHAIEFLRNSQSANEDQPFLLCWHTRAPHTTWLPVAEEDWAPYQDLDPKLPHPNYPNLQVDRAKRMTREYLASVRSVDRNLGRVLATLDELNLTDKTVVIFSSDHGYNMGHNGIWHKGNGHWLVNPPPPATDNIPKGQRPNMYDTSIKVPTIVVWPGVVERGSTVAQTVSNLDWFPTICSIAGVSISDDTLVRGRDFSPLLRGKKPTDWNNDYYGEYSTKHQSHTQMRMFSDGKHKLIRDFLNPNRDELYDLVADPGETTNRIADSQYDAIERRLHAEIVNRMRANSDPVLATIEPNAN
ncbi:MAG: sulfatase-like hydrolase/transferase [Planctomycetales bacterium]|nr:sulfatase-like hydrolase/transferase [Planctomycetales bacterium]